MSGTTEEVKGRVSKVGNPPLLLTPCGGKIIRASALNSVQGKLLPTGTIDEWVIAGKEPLRELLARTGTPDQPRVKSLLAWGEALQNAYEHARATRLRYYASADGRRVKLLAVYPTQRFDTNPPEPDLYAERGRGIWLMRECCRESRTGEKDEPGRDQSVWRFSGGELWLTLVISW